MNRRTTFKEVRCLVTGASSGLGRAITRELVRQQARVLLTGQRLASLESVIEDLIQAGAKPEQMVAIDADLTEPEGRGKLIHAIGRHFGVLDIVIHAANIDKSSLTDSDSTMQLRRILELELFALIDLNRALMPLLSAGKTPVLVITSTLAPPTNPGPDHTRASRSAVAGYLESIQANCSRAGIRILKAKADPQATEFQRELEAIQTLQAIQSTGAEFTKEPERSSIHSIPELLARFARRLFLAASFTPDSSQFPKTPLTRRLPRPHFGLRMKFRQKKGD